nr:MAG TPA: hypothetical protein [Caudoviricetes sp.]
MHLNSVPWHLLSLLSTTKIDIFFEQTNIFRIFLRNFLHRSKNIRPP